MNDEHIVTALLTTLKRAERIASEYLADIGGCDHAVGICVCGLRGDVQDIRDVIAKAENA